MVDSPSDVTQLLERWSQGDEAALDQLIPIVHGDLHRIAQRCMAGEKRGQTMQATVLVNEAYVRLVGAHAVTWQNRTHFLAVAARVMRRIIVDHARARMSQKRGGRDVRITFDEGLFVSDEPSQNFLVLDDSLEALARFDARKSQVVELRFFGGLTVEETAAVLNVSADTVMRDWSLAKAWLEREMRGAHDP